ncbi:MAG: hypothetical protein ABH856_02310 [Patescibacteria group bacterium]|nr:hypothetical protein [Patescibacteria group bacterium]
MQTDSQSYFGEVLKKLSEMKAKENIPVDEGFKARLRDELQNQDIVEAEPAVEDGEPRLVGVARRWQALFIGLPALLITVLVVIVVRGIFFGERGPETLFEKTYNVSYSGPFSDAEKRDEFKAIVYQLVKSRDSEYVKLIKQHSDKVLIVLKIRNDGREEFLMGRESGKWSGRGYELIRNET